MVRREMEDLRNAQVQRILELMGKTDPTSDAYAKLVKVYLQLSGQEVELDKFYENLDSETNLKAEKLKLEREEWEAKMEQQEEEWKAKLRQQNEEYERKVAETNNNFVMESEKLEKELAMKAENLEMEKKKFEFDKELELKRENREKWVKPITIGLSIAGVAAPIVYGSVWNGKMLKFEETGSMTSGVFRDHRATFAPGKFFKGMF